ERQLLAAAGAVARPGHEEERAAGVLVLDGGEAVVVERLELGRGALRALWCGKVRRARARALCYGQDLQSPVSRVPGEPGTPVARHEEGMIGSAAGTCEGARVGPRQPCVRRSGELN